MSKRISYQKGAIVGKLHFVSRAPYAEGDKNRHPMAIFLCQCGKEFSARVDSVRDDRIQSCGCISKKLQIEGQTFRNPIEYIISQDRRKRIKLIPKLFKHDLERFWSKVSITANPNKCWNWTANGQRYGSFKIGAGEYKSNRIAYFLHHNIDPMFLSVIHSCDNPKCCNPAHLSLGTHDDNMKDMVNKGRGNPRGIKNNQLININNLS